MAKRRRPAGARAAAAATTGPGGALGAAKDITTRQLTLPLAAEPQPPAEAHVAAQVAVHAEAHAAVAPAIASARALPPIAAMRDAPLVEETRPVNSVPVSSVSINAPRPARPSVPSGPREGRAHAHARLDDVRAALADGWEIVQPIFARPLWSVADNSTTAFNFVLRRERATRLVTVPEGRGVQRFIRDQHLSVDYRN